MIIITEKQRIILSVFDVQVSIDLIVSKGDDDYAVKRKCKYTCQDVKPNKIMVWV